MLVTLTGRATTIESEHIDGKKVRFTFLLETKLKAGVIWHNVQFDIPASAGCIIVEGDELRVTGNFPSVFRIMNALAEGELPSDQRMNVYASRIENLTRHASWGESPLPAQREGGEQ